MHNNFNNRLLIIDDNPAIHDDFRKTLSNPMRRSEELSRAEAVLFGQSEELSQMISFEIDSANQGEEGVSLVEKAVEAGRPYSVVFLDIRMPPGMDGVETALKLWSADPSLQIVLCTAFSDYLWEDIARRLGTPDSLLILKKPFDKLEVVQMAHALAHKWVFTRKALTRLDALQQTIEDRNELLRQSEERLRQAQKMEAIGQLAAGVAHDFNNILTIILGHSSLQMARQHRDPELMESLNQMSAAADRAASLTRQLLAFSRKQVMELRQLNINDLLKHLFGMLQRLIGEHIEIKFRLGPDLPGILGDICNIEQIIFNLLLNARDAMPCGGTITVATTLEELDQSITLLNPEAAAGHFVCLSVSDTGTGMDKETIEHIFEPFFTTKEVGEGTGMGLATVHGIVKQHNGWIEVESTLGSGSTFRVYLPLAANPVILTATPQISDIPQGNGQTVLLVEDEAPVRKLVRAIFVRYGYEVIEAANATEALEAWSRHKEKVGLLFTDMMIPGGKSGWDIAREMKAGKPGLHVIYTSGYNPGTFGDEFASEAGAAFITKPYQPGALAGALRSLLSTSA